MHFCYVFPGWEGSTYDNQVFKDAIIGKRFVIPVGKYWLGNTGYLNSDHLLVSYKRVKYYSKKTLLVLQKPKNAKNYSIYITLAYAMLFNVYLKWLKNNFHV